MPAVIIAYQLPVLTVSGNMVQLILKIKRPRTIRIHRHGEHRDVTRTRSQNIVRNAVVQLRPIRKQGRQLGQICLCRRQAKGQVFVSSALEQIA